MQITGSYWQMLCTDLIRGPTRLTLYDWLQALGWEAKPRIYPERQAPTGREKPYRLPSRSGASFMERY